MSTFRCLSHVKVNLWLELRGRRADGYHELFTIFDELELADELCFEAMDAEGTSLDVLDETGGAGLPIPTDDRNLVLAAAKAFHAHSGLSIDGRFVLVKRIPSGSGLGSGSSNAAACLRLLALRHGLDPVCDSLLQIARGIGADVPFFLYGHRAWATGRGDLIHPTRAGPKLHYLLLLPGYPASTAAVFRQLAPGPGDGPDDGKPPLLTAVPGSVSSAGTSSSSLTGAVLGREEGLAYDPEGFARRFLQTLSANLASGFKNDLLLAARQAIPALGTLMSRLEQLGCSGFQLSGSGSTIFFAGTEPKRLESLKARLAQDFAKSKGEEELALRGLGAGYRLLLSSSRSS